jgi:hypothetical protein
MVRFLKEIHRVFVSYFCLGPVKNNNNNIIILLVVVSIDHHSVLSSRNVKLYEIYNDMTWKFTIVTVIINQSEPFYK